MSALVVFGLFFKPFTFNHWLQQEVHPHLKFDDYPFQYWPEFAANPKLQRYAGQVVWINIVTPVIITVVVAILYFFFSEKIGSPCNLMEVC